MKQLCFFLLAAIAAAQSPAHQPPGTIVVDASEFYHEIPAGDNIGGGAGNTAGWLFNNSILNLGAKEDAVAKITVREAGDVPSVRARPGIGGQRLSGFGGRQACRRDFWRRPDGVDTGRVPSTSRKAP